MIWAPIYLEYDNGVFFSFKPLKIDTISEGKQPKMSEKFAIGGQWSFLRVLKIDATKTKINKSSKNEDKR